ncbi:MAG: glycosyltransferase family 1 protein [Alphaproteobacteria bacterium]|nr:MAG: glycosyltransferase family 1 protein [Alphaproteobacteria bacterium]
MPAAAPDQPPKARLLDLSRLVSRVGRGPWTGIDRVEAAYLAALLKRDDALFALVRTASAQYLLDRGGTERLARRLSGAEPWGPADWRSRLRRRSPPARRAAEADLRRLACDRAGFGGLKAMLLRHLPAGTVWLNVGHSNLGAEPFAAIHAVQGGRASILVHDTIPLDHPAWQRPGTVESFRARLETTARHADLVIVNSHATGRDAARHFAAAGRVPPMLVAHLGTEVPRPAETLPPGLRPERPYFVALGTIEPRKNHGFLLDLWAHLARDLPEAEMPALLILGARGWANEPVFRRLETDPLMGRHVFEHAGLDDATVAALVAGARALLAPSHAEGFGMPVAEALALGTRVIANDLAVYRETLGNNPVYVDVADMYSWAQAVKGLLQEEETASRAGRRADFRPQGWQEHFNLVLKVT